MPNYNPRTGITTYKNADAQPQQDASNPAPSTATSFAASQPATPSATSTSLFEPASASTSQRPFFSTIPEGYRQVDATKDRFGRETAPGYYEADEQLLKLLGFTPETRKPSLAEIRAGQGQTTTRYRDNLN